MVSPTHPNSTKNAATLATRAFASAAGWEAWLDKNASTSTGLWLKLTKKDAGPGHLPYPEVLDLALCFGWIDGQRKSHDARTFLQKFTRRAKRSVWSKINREKALALIKAGRMRPGDVAEIDRAKADGRWDAAYDSWKTAKESPELTQALAKNKKAAAFFATLDSRNRYAIIFRIHTAKRPETKAKRLALFIDMLARGETLYP